MVNSPFDPATTAYLAARRDYTEQTRRENEAALPLADYMRSLTPKVPLLPPGKIRQPAPDDFETFTPYRITQKLDIEDLIDERNVLQERVDYYEQLFDGIHAALTAAGVADGDLLTMVTTLIDGDDELAEVA